MRNYSLGHMAVKIAGLRYKKRLNEALENANKKEHASIDDMLGCTYLYGLYDMACLYAEVTDGVDMAEWLRKIDSRVDMRLSGNYEE